MLMVRTFKNSEGLKMGTDENYKRAWMRLCNEETNQTIDYAMMNKIEISENYQEVIQEEDEDGEGKQNELAYMMGAIHLEAENGKATWVFESYKHAIAASDVGFKDIGESVGGIYATAMKAFTNQ